MMIIVRPAAPTIHSVSVFICLVSGVSSRAVAESMSAILPTSVPLPVPVTTTTALPWVTGVCMKAMFDCSPGPISPAWQGGRVLVGRHALARQGRLVDLQGAGRDDPPVRRHLVAGRDQHHVPGHQLLRRYLGFHAVAPDPGRGLHHRLQGVHGALGLALLAQPDHGVEQ